MTGRDRTEDAPTPAPRVPWHNRTSTVLGVSLAGLAVLAILVISISHLTRQFGEPEQAPIDYVGPTSSAPGTRSPTTTTTETITSTSPPITSDIDPGLAPSTGESAAADSEPAQARTKSAEPSTSKPNYRRPRTRDPDGPPEDPVPDDPTTEATATLNPAT